jgi:DHA1 family bicyclomycin/chloramphenicol resistance-like MFS transporter
MTDTSAAAAAPSRGAPIPFAEFVALVASSMALVALGIDTMLPALPAIGESLGVADPNRRQFVVTAFVTGFGVAQLVHGPLADRFGRRRLMLAALLTYAVANIACAAAASFALLLAARLVGGMVVAAVRVAIIATVRDCYEGRPMARVMSIAFMVFMIVPVIAPAIGQGVLLVGSWRLIFAGVAVMSLLVCGWYAARMPETLDPADRAPLSLARVVGGWRVVATERLSLGYTLAAMALTGALYGYLNSVEQIMADVFARPRLLGAVFAGCAVTMAAANLINARLVLRVGTRRMGHGALAGVAVFAGLHLALIAAGGKTLVTFVVMQALTLGCFGLSTSNFSAMAMERMGHIAGTASSLQGFASITGGAVLGVLVGQAFDGTAVPMVAGFLLAALAALMTVAATERGRLFRPS